MGIKKMIVSVLSSRKVAIGYTGKEARRWTRKVYHHYTDDKRYSFRDTRWAIKRGFMPEQVELMGLNEENYKDTISAKEYAFLRPLNGGYSKWISDKITVNSIFKPFKHYMPNMYYQITVRDGEPLIIPLKEGLGDTFDDVLKLIRDKGNVRIGKTTRDKFRTLKYINNKYFIGDNEISESAIVEFLSHSKSNMAIFDVAVSREEFKGIVLKLIVINSQGDNPKIGDAYIRCKEEHRLRVEEHEITSLPNLEELNIVDDEKLEEVDEKDEKYSADDTVRYYASVDLEDGSIGDVVKVVNGQKKNSESGEVVFPKVIEYWDEIKNTVDEICRFVPQLEFFGMDIVIGDDQFYITRLKNNPTYPVIVPFSKETSDYLKQKVIQKKEAYDFKKRVQRFFKKVKLKIRSTYAKMFFPKGLLPYLSIRWFQDLKNDFKTNKDTTFKEKIWAAKHGFLSYRLPQYGINEDNYRNFISDFEYKWLRHINNKYRYWMEDKITVKYICSEYNECFPEYYYHIILKNGNNKVIKMMDCPSNYSNSFEDIFELVKEKKVLAMKPDEGSHGDGFYKFEYRDGNYYLNHELASEEKIISILQDVNNQYIITEYINMHEEIKKIYDGAVNTIRMIVFKKDGKTPVIGNAYMRFGSKKTGAVDNMGAGGMFAKIDIDTGRFYDSKIILDNEIKECLYHPDTGVKIEGILPNWDKTKELVLNVAKGIPQLEYFGFDLAITENGVKFPEINRFPDYPAIEKYTDKTIDYLLYKLEAKKKLYGYEDNKNHSLVHLPRR